jgi:hypothetical protein
MKMNNKRKNVIKVTKLYHYVNFDCERLAQIISQSKLYCCSPKDFNDPFDSKIQATFRGCTDDDFRFIYRDFIGKAIKPKLEPKQITERVEGIIRNGDHRKHENQEKLRDHTIKTLQKDIDKFGMICLTEERDDILMWSHYGGDHKGLCLEFDKQLLDKNFICRKVNYFQRYPRYIEFYRRFVKANETAGETENAANEATEDLGRFIMCRKSKHWEYEHEWRIIIPRQRIDLQKGDRFVSYPEGMLTGIIFGCNMTESQQAVIETLISKRSVKPILFKSRKNLNKFKLDIKELDIQTST